MDGAGLWEGEVLFEDLNQVSRRSDFQGQVPFLSHFQEMFLIMGNKPIGRRVNRLGKHMGIGFIIHIHTRESNFFLGW